MTAPTLETRRLLLRPFAAHDLPAVYEIFSDVQANRFLPWFPVSTLEEAEQFYQARLAPGAGQGDAYHYAICLKQEDRPIGYVNASLEDCYDFGYGLRRAFWHQGIATEAGGAVIQQLKRDGLPYLTATHDVNNPRSGAVMQRLGMQYCYTYRELWMPKCEWVHFRLYQQNLNGTHRVCEKYWNDSLCHFIETDLSRPISPDWYQT